MSILSIYAPQAGLDTVIKDAFYDELHCSIVKIGESENLFLCGDFNGHIGNSSAGYDGVHGGFGIGERNVEGEGILEFSIAYDLVICNSLFRASSLVTYQSGGSSIQVDYVLTRRCDLKLVRNAKVIPGENVLCNTDN